MPPVADTGTITRLAELWPVAKKFTFDAVGVTPPWA